MNYSKGALWEIFYPFIFTTLIVVVAITCSSLIQYDFIKISDSGLGAFGTIFGFLIAILTIINSLDNKYIQRLKAEKNFSLMQGYLKNAVISSFVSIGACSTYSFLFMKNQGCYSQVFGFFLLFILVYAFLSSFRFLIRFLKIIGN